MKQPRLSREVRAERRADSSAHESAARAAVFIFAKDMHKIPSPDWNGEGCAWRYTCYQPGRRPSI